MRVRQIISGLYHAVRAETPRISTKDVTIGNHVYFGRNVVINSKRVRIGDGVIFGDNVRVDSDVFEIGDYGTVYHGCFFPGPGTLCIGHNFWVGTMSIVDAHGGTTIGNNVCVGAHSQLWAHMIFGDVMYGCRFCKSKPMEIADDVWFVGECLVSPIRAGARSLAMLGSLITRDMEADHCYGGVPAKDITDKVGPQFEITDTERRVEYLQQKLELFRQKKGLCSTGSIASIVTSAAEMQHTSFEGTIFNVADRTYRKTGTETEFELIRFLLPKAKFIPVS